jgi:ATP-dependent helicase HrpA
VQRNRRAIEDVREAWRRSGGATPRLGQAELTAWYREQLRDARSLQEYRAAALRLDPDAFVPREARARLLALPGAVEVRGRTVPMHYEVEESANGPAGVMRLVLHEKVARGLVAQELPPLDRPVRFTVTRGARGSVKADSLEELQDALDRPFTDDEVQREAQAPPRDQRHGRPWQGGGRGVRDERGGASKGAGARGGHEKSSHRPGSPAGRGKRRGKGR